ncbi:hypothetical protein AKJ16_DCAP22245 [Drosera capensis]
MQKSEEYRVRVGAEVRNLGRRHLRDAPSWLPSPRANHLTSQGLLAPVPGDTPYIGNESSALYLEESDWGLYMVLSLVDCNCEYVTGRLIVLVLISIALVPCFASCFHTASVFAMLKEIIREIFTWLLFVQMC